jgi:hypothetical protein
MQVCMPANGMKKMLVLTIYCDFDHQKGGFGR